MRPDLDKCTTECYRRGAGSLEHTYKIKFGGTVKVVPDPEHEYDNERGGFHSSARHRHKESKDFGDKLGALRGNIRANVGRPWDDVFSEFCQNLDRRSINGHHIWTHLTQEVELNAYIGVDDKIYSYGRYGWRGEVTGYYVHPVTGILEYKDPRSWKRHIRRQEKEVTIPVPNAEGWHYRQIDGLWFKLREEFVPEKYWYDSVLGKRGKIAEHWIISEKRSANRKEIAWVKEQLGVV